MFDSFNSLPTVILKVNTLSSVGCIEKFDTRFLLFTMNSFDFTNTIGCI